MAFSASKSVLRRRFIVDTDVGVDDLVAIRSLLLHLNQEQQQDNVLLSTVHGISETHVGSSYLQRVFPHLTVLESPLIPPQAKATVPAWLTGYRAGLDKVLKELPTTSLAARPIEHSFESLYAFLRNSPHDDSVTLLCLGPLSNVAEWHKQQGPLLEEKLSEIWILGGNDPRDKEQTPEFNLAQDANASHQVFGSSLASKIRLVLASETSPDKLPQAVAQIKEYVIDKSGLLARLLQFRPQDGCFDPMAAFVVNHVDSAATYKPVPISVDADTGLLSSASGHAISLVQDIQVETGYLPWLRMAIDLDEAEEIAS